MTLHQWAARWGVSGEAVADLQRQFGMYGLEMQVKSRPDLSGTEGDAQNAIRLEAGRKGVALFRNNVGAMKREDGSGFIRYGLANDSKAVNDKIKSADLIGIRPIVIGPGHVGATIGQFVSREVKAPGWYYTATDREQAQLRWIELITAKGGDACFATGEGTL